MCTRCAKWDAVPHLAKGLRLLKPFALGVTTLRFRLMLPHLAQVLQEWHADVMSHSVVGMPVVCESVENPANPH